VLCPSSAQLGISWNSRENSRLSRRFVEDFGNTTAADLRELGYHMHGAPVLMVILDVCMRHTVGADAIVKRLMGLEEDEETKKTQVRPMISDQVGSHVVEKALGCASPGVVLSLYNEYFRGELMEWSKLVTANFAVQRLLEKADHAGQVTALLEELAPCFPELMEVHRPGVILKAVEMCGRSGVGQKAAYKALLAALDCPEDQVVERLLNISQAQHAPVEEGQGPESSAMGTRILQALFTFNQEAAAAVMREFSKTDKAKALELAKQNSGSHVIEAFVRSEALPKYKKQFLKAFEGQVTELAMHKVGSRVIEACYTALDTDEKRWMVQELADNEDKLSQNFFGRFALRKCRVQTFKTGGAQAWAAQEESSEGVRDMFGDLMNAEGGDFFGGGDEAAGKKKDKKKKKKASGEGDDSDAEIDALLSDVKREKKAGKAAEEAEEEDEGEKQKKKNAKKKAEAEEPKEALPEFITEALEGLTKKGKKKKRKKSEEQEAAADEEEEEEAEGKKAKKAKKAKKEKKARKFEA